MDHQIEHYVEHAGTVRISGKTLPKSAGFCAFSYLQKGISPIDFFYIGGNAGQQAMKAMSVFCHLVRQDSNESLFVAFVPLRFLTVTKDKVTQTEKDKDAAVWRAFLLTKGHEVQFTSKVQRSNGGDLQHRRD